MSDKQGDTLKQENLEKKNQNLLSNENEEKMRERLIALGIPKEEIIHTHDIAAEIEEESIMNEPLKSLDEIKFQNADESKSIIMTEPTHVDEIPNQPPTQQPPTQQPPPTPLPPTPLPPTRPGMMSRMWRGIKRQTHDFGAMEYTLMLGSIYLGSRFFARECWPSLKRLTGLSHDTAKKIRVIVKQPVNPLNSSVWRAYEVSPTVIRKTTAIDRSLTDSADKHVDIKLFGIQLTPYGEIITKRAMEGSKDKVTRVRVIHSSEPTLECPVKQIEGLPYTHRLSKALIHPLTQQNLSYYLLDMGLATVSPRLKDELEVANNSESILKSRETGIPTDVEGVISALYWHEKYAQRRLNGIWKNRYFVDLDRPVIRMLYTLYRPLYTVLIHPLCIQPAGGRKVKEKESEGEIEENKDNEDINNNNNKKE